jgi:hypothetical protein
VELLLLLALNPDRQYDVDGIISAMRPSALTEQAARRYLQQFETRGLVSARPSVRSRACTTNGR